MPVPVDACRVRRALSMAHVRMSLHSEVRWSAATRVRGCAAPNTRSSSTMASHNKVEASTWRPCPTIDRARLSVVAMRKYASAPDAAGNRASTARSMASDSTYRHCSRTQLARLTQSDKTCGCASPNRGTHACSTSRRCASAPAYDSLATVDMVRPKCSSSVSGCWSPYVLCALSCSVSNIDLASAKSPSISLADARWACASSRSKCAAGRSATCRTHASASIVRISPVKSCRHVGQLHHTRLPRCGCVQMDVCTRQWTCTAPPSERHAQPDCDGGGSDS